MSFGLNTVETVKESKTKRLSREQEVIDDKFKGKSEKKAVGAMPRLQYSTGTLSSSFSLQKNLSKNETFLLLLFSEL